MDRVHLPNLIYIAVSPSMHDHLIAVSQPLQVGKRSYQAVRKYDMTGDHTVPAPGRERGSLQISDVVPQPGDVPSFICFWDAENGGLKT